MKKIPWRNISLLILFSVITIIGLLFIIYEKESQTNLSKENLSFFIFINTSLNSLSAICIVLGKWAIVRKKFLFHKRSMISAFCFSALFLVSYVYYHYNQGNTLFSGEGLIRPIYFFILISHLILAAFTLPAVLVTFYFAFSNRFRLHKAIAPYTINSWLYVSITGVLIYLLLEIYN